MSVNLSTSARHFGKAQSKPKNEEIKPSTESDTQRAQNETTRNPETTGDELALVKYQPQQVAQTFVLAAPQDTFALVPYQHPPISKKVSKKETTETKTPTDTKKSKKDTKAAKAKEQAANPAIDQQPLLQLVKLQSQNSTGPALVLQPATVLVPQAINNPTTPLIAPAIGQIIQAPTTNGVATQRRELTDTEQKQIEEGLKQSSPKSGYSLPVAKLLASPKSLGTTGAILGGPMTGLATAFICMESSFVIPAALIAAGVGATVGFFTGSSSRKEENKTLIEFMHMLPEGATQYDLWQNSVYQAMMMQKAIRTQSHQSGMLDFLLMDAILNRNSSRYGGYSRNYSSFNTWSRAGGLGRGASLGSNLGKASSFSIPRVKAPLQIGWKK